MDGLFSDKTIGIEVQQQDMICSQCPLADCDEESLFCAFRWATQPNREQLKLLRRKPPTAKDRREYFRQRYLQNRSDLLARSNERNARLRAEAAATT